MKGKKLEVSVENILALVGVSILIVGGILSYKDIGIFGNFILLSLLFIVFPRVIIAFFKYQRIKVFEEIFPVFLQDLAEWQKSGLTFQEALRNASHTNYGKLTGEIKKIVAQISWGVSVQDALRSFAERVNSNMIRKAVEIIIESYESGGNLQETLEALAKDIYSLKEIDRQRQSVMSQHIVTMYIIYFVFLGISTGLLKTIVPLTSSMGPMEGGTLFFQDPCAQCKETHAMECISCTVFLGVAKMFFLGSGSIGYYRGLFFSMLAIEGILAGLICGQIGEKSIKGGIKHSIILTLLGLGIFMIIIRVGVV